MLGKGEDEKYDGDNFHSIFPFKNEWKKKDVNANKSNWKSKSNFQEKIIIFFSVKIQLDGFR